MKTGRRIGFVAVVLLATLPPSKVGAGLNFQGLNFQGLNFQGLNFQGLNFQGLNFQGLNFQGLNFQGLNFQGLNFQGLNFQGLNFQGLNFQGLPLLGVDRARGVAGTFNLVGLAYADAQLPSFNCQGLQAGGPINYVQITNSMSGVHLQAGPTDPSPGSYIFVPGLAGTPSDLKGSLWNMVLANKCTADTQCTSPATCVNGSCSASDGGIGLYIADVERDTHQNSSKYSSNDDIYLYTIYYRQPATGEWASLCPLDIYGDPRAMAVPLNPNDWTSDASRAAFAFACTGSGVAAKCARNWGYKPWKTVTENVWNPTTGFTSTQVPLAPFYNACLVAARANYCQDGNSYTQNGTLVDLFDTLDGFTSINPTAGLPFAPFSTGVMLHEEYQISALNIGSNPAEPHFVSENYTADQLASLPADQQTLVESLSRSGMESSRYADLDPGRSCAAAPYIDRCDPKEPYDCYRAADMSSQSYGAFLAVNSPRHCSHDENTDGEPLDPLCNECVNRICQVDPTCCGDPGSTFYPGTLVWDSRCSAIRSQVCKSSADPAALLWPLGVTAPPAGSHPTVFLSGAVGSFEGIVSSGPSQFAEGWACDPDFPGTSIPIQISVGGELGAAGATLYTATADQTLETGWQEAVAAACGGAGRQGFRFQLPAGPPGQDVYVYGIDLNVPGAPFSLLRGGKKTEPTGSATNPEAAIWTGWVQPSVSGSYTFFAGAGDGDLYRVWVNGIYLAGNWVDPDPTVPGAFTLTAPTTPPCLYLLQGVRYGVRVEYLRPASLPATSQFSLSWSQDGGATIVPVPSTAFYPMAQGSGSGLLGTYSVGGTLQATQVNGAVDYIWTPGPVVTPPAVSYYVWTSESLPVPGPVPALPSNGPFTATFEGQVVPPISGDYTFTADTDGTAQITVNGQLVTDASTLPTGGDDPTCSHDICTTGAAVSRTCPEGFFCSGLICDFDPPCCSITWDARCQQEVAQICGLNCNPTPPVQITLSAGVKYDIRVDYQHQTGGAKLRLMWALPGSPSAVIPAERLFALPVLGASAPGVGINAAYFSDAAFTVEYLDHVDPTPSFQATTPPGPTLAGSLMCTSGTCGAGGPPGPPALVGATMNTATANGVPVTVAGGGAAQGATFAIWDGTSQSGSWVATTQVVPTTVSAIVGGTFTFSVSLPPGPHALAATQTVTGQTSAFSAPLAFTAADPAAPPPPTVTVPVGGYVSGNGNVQISGTAAPNATVTVTVGGTSTTFTTDGSGNWSGTLTLPGVGSFSLSITQTVGGITSATGATATVNVALPPLTVTAPTDGATVSNPVNVVGAGADPSLGNVIVGDGDGTFFTDSGTVSVNPDGSFSGNAGTLDYGRHQLKIFQRANGLDGAGVLRTVQVPPPLGALTITSPSSGAVVGASIEVIGSGGLPRIGPDGGVGPGIGTGLPGTVIVYEGTTKVGEGTRANDGSFAIPVTLTGAGSVTLTVSQTASSLSGGGSAESAQSAPVTVVVRPGAPVITSPATGTVQPVLLTIVVAGTAAPGASVEIDVDGVNTMTVTAAGTNAPVPGAFSTPPLTSTNPFPLTLTNGTHVLTAIQTLAGSTSQASLPVLVTLGDVTPPNVKVDEFNITASASDVVGTTVDFASHVTATDAGCPASSGCPITCSPASGSLFPMGSTAVSCQATDAAGNRGSTSFEVTVSSTAGPTVSGSNLVAEAQGPGGAAVAYQITATGFTTNCAAPGSGLVQACNTWQPAYKGLGFVPTAVALDPNDGSAGGLYAGFSAPASFTDTHTGCTQTLLKSLDRGVSWQPLSLPQTSAVGTCAVSQILVTPSTASAPATIYFLSASGMSASRDGGLSWTSALPGNDIRGIAADPTDPLHFYAWTDTSVSPAALYETHDGWQTQSNVSDGLPSTQILAVALDPLNAGRAYLSVSPTASDAQRTKLYQRIVTGPWQRLSVPPYSDSLASAAPSIAIAPRLDLCQPGLPGQSCAPCPSGQGPSGSSCQIFPTVFAGTVISRDGGGSWLDFPFLFEADAVVFDRQNQRTMYASTSGNFFRSDDSGQTWSPTGFFSAPVDASIVQDVSLSQTFYSATGNGLFTTSNGGQLWSGLSAPGLSLNAGTIRDLAADPADPTIAYVLTDTGIFKTQDGGGSWTRIGTGVAGVTDPTAFGNASRVLVDRFNRNNVYFGGNGLWKSPDGGTSWTDLGDGVLAGSPSAFALDPLIPGTVVGASLSNGNLFELSGTVENDFGANEETDVVPNPTAYNLQIVPDRGRNLLLSFDGLVTESLDNQPDLVELVGDTWVISLADQESFLQGQPGPQAFSTIGTSLNVANVVFDASDGTNRLFVGGGAIGKDASVLYRARLEDFVQNRTFQWEALGGGNGFSDFTRFVVDPGAGGQVIHTLGSGNTFWDSPDGGLTWQQDISAPAQHVNNTWVSPVDGAVYATIMDGSIVTSDRFQQVGADRTEDAGTLWKRTPTTGTPPGIPVVEGSIRPVCTGANPDMAIGPGSTFPLGDTTITCTATDVFRTSTKTITITVQDTTPPQIQVPVPAPTGVAGPGQSVNITYNVTASDAVDSLPTVSCAPASGSSFPYGTTTVLCTAADHATPTPNVTTASFPVTVSNGTLVSPTLTTPGDQTIEAQGPDGATADLVVQATTGGSSPQPLVPTCTPSLAGTFPLGTTDVTCSATAAGATATGTFRVTVTDTTPPSIVVPADLQVSAEATWGAHVTFAATATDLVDTSPIAVACSPASGEAFPLGETQVSCHATDKAGNQATAHFNVTVADLNPPVLHLTDVTVDAQDSTGARVTYAPPPSATDVEDGSVPVDCLPASGSWFPLNVQTTVPCTATDRAGNETRGSFQVLVSDLSPPTLTVPGTITVEAAGSAGTAVPFVVSASDLVDGVVTPTCAIVTALGSTPVVTRAVFPVGENQVTCVAKDHAGNVGSASFKVVVGDTTPPVLTLPAPITVNADSTATAVVSYVATANDAVAGAVPVACLPSTGSRFPIGTTIVTCTARDAAGNTSVGTFAVTVLNTAPVVTVPANMIVEATGPSGSIVTFVATALDTQDGVRPVTCTPASGTTFVLGTTTVTCTATDTGKLTGSASFTVTVRDTTPPVLTLPAPITVNAGAGGTAVVTYTATASDLVGPVTVTCAPPSGTAFTTGTTTVTCVAKDAANNQATGSFTVTVKASNTPPVVTVPSNMIVEATGPSGSIVTFTATATDAQDGARPVTCTPASGTTFALGTRTVTCTATDTGGLTGTASFTVTVRDTTPPVLTLPAPITVSAGTGGTAVVTYSATASDLVSGTVAVTCTPASGSAFAVGTTTVTCVAKDAAGNQSQGSFTVTVQAAGSPPVVTVPANLIVEATGPTGAKVTFTASAHDANGAALVPVCTPASGATFPLGTTTVTCTAVDHTGLSASKSFTVTVRDTTGPVFSNVPAPISAFATSTGGAKVSYTLPKATDAVDGARTVICTPASGGQFPVGNTQVSCKASDTRGNFSTATFTVSVTYQAPTDGTFFLFPIQSNGGSIFPIGPLPLPVRFRLTGASAGITNLVAKFSVTKTSSSILGSVNEVSDETVSDTGLTFIYRPLLQWYAYRWKISDQTQGTYQIKADLGDGVVHQINVSLRR
jgi:hypothetical protein